MKARMSLGEAEGLGLKVLGWLVEQGHVEGFLAHTGLSVSELRTRAEDPHLLAAVLSFLLANEPFASAFCAQQSVPAPDLHLAEHLLGGTT